ncbi:hypothetical protein RB598_007377 [Gaeumannomyces tritici]
MKSTFLTRAAAAAAAALLLLAPLASAAPPPHPRPEDPVVTYDGHQVFRVANAPRALEDELGRRRLHTMRAGGDLDVVVPPDQAAAFSAARRGLDAQLLHADLGALIRRESRPGPYVRDGGSSLHRRRGEVGAALPDMSWFDSYHPYDDHLQYWRDLQAAFPNNSRITELDGKSHEGRPLHLFQMWGDNGPSPVGTKPVVLWHSTVHAREWITTMVVEYLTHQLISGYKTNQPNPTRFLDEYDFYIVPFHNPDGFVHTQTTNRLWRKNRQPREGTTCVGTDNNRNWAFQWDHPLDGGSVSSDPCGETFRGRAGGDTPENRALASLSARLAARPAGIRSYVDWHSYSQLILLPWGFSCRPEDLPANLPRQREVGAGYAAAINATTGMPYQVGPSCEVLYYSTGSGRDYHAGAHNATFSWSVELRPRTAAEGGFVLQPEFIRPTAEEHWAGMQWVLNDILKD